MSDCNALVGVAEIVAAVGSSIHSGEPPHPKRWTVKTGCQTAATVGVAKWTSPYDLAPEPSTANHSISTSQPPDDLVRVESCGKRIERCLI
jgi:hypothetical protein